MLVVDEHGDRKWGKHTAHVGRQYLANLGKTDSGVASVTSLWADETVYSPLDHEPRSLRDLGGGAGRDGQPDDGGTGAQAPELVAQEKTLVASERDETARHAWRGDVTAPDTAALVFVDECGTHLALTPPYAWTPQAERAHGAVPRNRGQHPTPVAALSATAAHGPAPRWRPRSPRRWTP